MVARRKLGFLHGHAYPIVCFSIGNYNRKSVVIESVSGTSIQGKDNPSYCANASLTSEERTASL